MGEPGFTVSVPDLIGFSDQIDHLGKFYSSLGEDIAVRSVELSFVPTGASLTGLTGVLTLFMDDFTALTEAERAAAHRLGDGLSATHEALALVASSYQNMDQAAMERLTEAAPSEEDQAVDAAIDQSGARSDWSRQLNSADYVGDFEVELPTMKYEGPFLEANTALSVLGNVPATIDALVQEFFGFSIIKSITTPLLGNWGFLYVMRDVCAAEANAFEAVSMVLADGAATLVGTDWTGEAADSFHGHLVATRLSIDRHVTNLRDASRMYGHLGDVIDAAGNDLANLINELINDLLAVFMAIANAGIQIVSRAVSSAGGLLDAISIVGAGISGSTNLYNLSEGEVWETVKGTAGPVVGKIISAVEGLCEAIDAASTSTLSLCQDANALEPPPVQSAGIGDTVAAEPEGLTEEPKENEPEGLTEEPNDAVEPGTPQQQR